MYSKEDLLKLLQISDQDINYRVTDGQVFHNRTGLIDNNFLLNRTIHMGKDDIILIYYDDKDQIQYRAFNSALDITFDSYKVIDNDIHLFHDNIEYVLKNASRFLVDGQAINRQAFQEGGYGEHMIIYRGDSVPLNSGKSISFRFAIAGYPKDEQDYLENDYMHSFDYIEQKDNQFKFVSKAYLDTEFNFVCDYLPRLKSKTIKQKLEIYKNGFDLLPYAALVYYPRTDFLSFFINDKGDLDFSANFYFVNKLKGIDAFEDIKIINKNKEVFSSPFFENFIKSFKHPFQEYLKTLNFDIDVDIQTIDDLVRYKQIVDMHNI